MKPFISTILTVAVATTAAIASPLVDKAKSAGLAPIPSSTSELLKMIDNDKNPITDAKVELGKQLYFDPRLSKSGLISCNTCHNLAMGGADGVPAAIGHKWAANPHHLNSPTVYNAVFHSSQFWDGRSPHLEDQAQGPIQAKPEMAASKELVAERVNSIPEYVRSFKKAYGKDVEITFAKVADTIAVFERTLVTPSRFDSFMEGCDKAMTPAEKKGLETFIDKGCATCHNGVALGGALNSFPLYGKFKHEKVGDFDSSLVKVPTLRNITETAPYFHNGTVWSLAETVKIMGQTQLDKGLSDTEVEEIVTFLKVLEGKKPAITYPVLPASTDKTPVPVVD
jgi:cytochrome c peroxidase